MKKKISLIVLIIVLGAIGLGATNVRAIDENNTTISEEYIPSETIENIIEMKPTVKRIYTTEKSQLEILISDCAIRKSSAHALAEAARALGFSEDYPVIRFAGIEWNAANEDQKYYKTTLKNVLADEEAKKQSEWNRRETEYPVAAQVWKALRDAGYNEYVCAGIIGNMMAETSGSSLKLCPGAASSTHYGLCQWSKLYFPGMNGAGVNTQISFLLDSIENSINAFGPIYQKGFDYKAFCNLDNEKDAALWFAKCYERCGTGTYNLRKENATIAYNYFGGFYNV